jgi:CHAT domain-containing protein
MNGWVRQGQYVEDMLTATAVETYGNLGRPDGSGPLVFLNACQVGRAGYSLTGLGGFARAFLNIKAGAFVGTLWSIGDTSALTFAETFYEKLMAGKTIAETTIAARQAAKNAEDVTWLSYVVYGHPSGRVST